MNVTHRVGPRTLLVAGCGLLLGACQEPITTIGYTQVGACDAGENKALVVFRLGRIDNSQSNRDFTFDPGRHRLDADMSQKSPWPYYERMTGELMFGPREAAGPRITVPKGASDTQETFVVFRRETIDSDGSRQANKTAYFLGYDRNAVADPPIMTVKSNAGQTEWRDTSSCGEIARYQYP